MNRLGQTDSKEGEEAGFTQSELAGQRREQEESIANGDHFRRKDLRPDGHPCIRDLEEGKAPVVCILGSSLK